MALELARSFVGLGSRVARLTPTSPTVAPPSCSSSRTTRALGPRWRTCAVAQQGRGAARARPHVPARRPAHAPLQRPGVPKPMQSRPRPAVGVRRGHPHCSAAE
ncbi:hypothetical protein QJS66_11510 [Kocuria rhizophila]|nr:hypothetical protein QJS66_11510 [Kocuria rhizophila]